MPHDPSHPVSKPIVWDSDQRRDYLPKEGHIRGTTIYLSAALTEWMEAEWGLVTHVKTSTDPATSEVMVVRVPPGEAFAVPVRRYGALNAGSFAFWRPLRKLSLKVPRDRQFNVTPFTRQVPGVGTAFIFPMAQRVSVPRSTRQEEEAAEVAAEMAALAAPAKDPE